MNFVFEIFRVSHVKYLFRFIFADAFLQVDKRSQDSSQIHGDSGRSA